MTVNRFSKLRAAIHFHDNSLQKPGRHRDHDRLHKIRPVLDHLNQKFQTMAPFGQRLSLDEQICSTKISHFMKQYLPNKPHKWGFKFVILCSLNGYAHNFEVYCGKGKHDSLSGEPNMGVIGNVVVRICRVIPRKGNILFASTIFIHLFLLCITFGVKEYIV